MRSNINTGLINTSESFHFISLKGGSEDTDSTLEKNTDLKKECSLLQQENSKLQAIIQDVTSVNKRWQLYNNDRQVYVQKLLQTIQDLQEQINTSSEKKLLQQNTTAQDEIDKLRKQSEINEKKLKDTTENLKREHREHIAVLELQIKSHKDDWEAERKEKQKIEAEKEYLELQLRNLMKDVMKTKQPNTPSTCCYCMNNPSASSFYTGDDNNSPVKVSKTILPKTYRTSVHFPYKSSQLLSKGSSLYFDEELVKDCNNLDERDSGIQDIDRIDDVSYNIKEESQFKSILKKEEKKQTLTQHYQSDFGYFNQLQNTNDATVSLGFYNDGLANVTTFEQDSKKKLLEQNDCSSTKPGLWENTFSSGVDTETRDSIICPSCDAVFPPPSHLQFLDHFEICQKKSNELKSDSNT